MTQVPIIDISALFGGDTAACREVANKIGQACRDIGFIVIVGHQVRDELIDRVWKSTQSFFDLPVSPIIIINNTCKITMIILI